MLETESLRELAKLYAYLTYFHPKADDTWADATEKHFPEVLRRADTASLSRWLEALHDPLTGVLGADEAPTELIPGYTAQGATGWPILTLPDLDWVLTPEGELRLGAFLREASGATGALLDLRAQRPPTRRATERFATLTNGIAQPTLWQRAHYGKVPELASATGDFRTGWVGREASCTRIRWPRTAVLMNRHSPLAPFVLALAQCGLAAIVWEGAGELTPWAPTASLPLPGGDRVRFRTGLSPLPTVLSASDALAEARRWLASSDTAPKTSLTLPVSPPPLRAPRTRLHAALRLWSALWLLHPRRAALQPILEQVLPGFLAQVQTAGDAAGFHRAARRFLRLTGDGHALTLSALESGLFGEVPAAVRLQTIEGKPTIVAVYSPVAEALGARVGEVVTAVEGVPVTKRRALLDPYLAAGTPQARENYLNNRLTLGANQTRARLTLEGGRTIAIPRLLQAAKERVEPIVRSLARGVGYADLDRLTREELPGFFTRFAQAPGLIFDLRGYVEELAWELAPYLAPEGRPGEVLAARFVRPVALPPEDGEVVGRLLEESFAQTIPPRRPGQRRYRGRVAVLIDERTQSQAEHTALFLRACGALLIGSPSAGAVGDVTNLALTDGIMVRFSGQEVRFPDGTRVAGVGIQPDRRVRPTRRGLRAGRDEVLEAALTALL